MSISSVIREWKFRRLIEDYKRAVSSEHPWGLDWDTLQVVCFRKHLARIDSVIHPRET